MFEKTHDNTWAVAREVTKTLGYVPIAFAQAIRMLATDHLKNKGELRAVTKYQIARLFRGASFKSTIYFASKELAEDYLAANKACSIGDIVALYKPFDLAAFITCFFLNRQMRKVAGPAWEEISPYFSKESSVGALVGVALPRVGFGPGLVIASLRNVAHGLMSLKNPGSYATYRTKLAASKKLVDDKLEMEIWKTTSSQVTSLLLTNLGYMTEIGELIGTAAGTTTPISKITDEKLRNFRLSYIWQETFLLKQEQPSEKFNTEYFPLAKDKAKAKKHVDSALNGSKSWLDRGKEDLTRELAPHFFEKIPTDPNLEIPDELKDVFSVKELTEMNENDFDALIDQIDEEQKAASKRDDVISAKDLEELQKQID